jgi:hypothetical protein
VGKRKAIEVSHDRLALLNPNGNDMARPQAAKEPVNDQRGYGEGEGDLISDIFGRLSERFQVTQAIDSSPHLPNRQVRSPESRVRREKNPLSSQLFSR